MASLREIAKDNSLAMIANIEAIIKWDFNRDHIAACHKFSFKEDLKVAVIILHHGMVVDGTKPLLKLFNFENDLRFKYDCKVHGPMYERALFSVHS